MKLLLCLQDGRKTQVQFCGTMKEAYLAYDNAPFNLDGVESTVSYIKFVPDPVDIHEQDVTACFIADLGVSIICCADFRLHLAPYYQDQMGHEIVCTLQNGRKIVQSSFYRPRVLLISGAIAVPDEVLYEHIKVEAPLRSLKKGRLGALDPKNLDLIAAWCRQVGYHHKFI